MSYLAELHIQPAADYFIKTDAQANDWIVNKRTGAAYMSLTTLAHVAEVSKATLSGLLTSGRELPKGLQGADFSTLARIERVGAYEPYLAVPADTCYQVICYYAYEARYAYNRKHAKELAKAMGKAGSTVFIYAKAGYVFNVSPPPPPSLSSVKLSAPKPSHLPLPLQVESSASLTPLTTLELLELSLKVAKEHEARVQALEITQQEQSELIKDLANRVEQLAAQPNELLQAQQQAREYLDSLDTQGVKPIEYPIRVQLNQLVRAYCINKGITFREAWNRLYQSFRDSEHIDLKVRAKHMEIRAIDYADRFGHLPTLMRIALQVFAF